MVEEPKVANLSYGSFRIRCGGEAKAAARTSFWYLAIGAVPRGCRFKRRSRPFTTETYGQRSKPLEQALPTGTSPHFHVDLSDALALLCVRQNPDAPRSLVASAAALWRSLERTHPPEALEELVRGFRWSRQGEEGEGEDPDTPFRIPVFSATDDGVFSSRFNRSWISLSEHERKKLFANMQQILLDQSLAIDVRPGDIQFISNHTCVHAVERHVTGASVPPEQKRQILRTWLDIPCGRPVHDPHLNRFGPGRFGLYCLTPDELVGIERGEVDSDVHVRQARRADGAPIRANV